VGENTGEKVDPGVRGGKYGWPITEKAAGEPRFVNPLVVYNHGPNDLNGCAITGGTFYDPANPRLPARQLGSYYYTDVCGNWIQRYNPATNRASRFATSLPAHPVALTVTPGGQLLVLSRGRGGKTGVITSIGYRVPRGPRG